VLCDLARVRIRIKFWVRLGVRVSVRSEICELHVCYFETAHRILQVTQIDKSGATFTQKYRNYDLAVTNHRWSLAASIDLLT